VCIVEAYCTAGLSKRIHNIVCCSGCTTFNVIVSSCDKPCRIKRLCPCDQLALRICISLSQAIGCSFLYLVSERPHNDGRSILPSLDHSGQIELCPCHSFFCA